MGGQGDGERGLGCGALAREGKGRVFVSLISCHLSSLSSEASAGGVIECCHCSLRFAASRRYYHRSAVVDPPNRWQGCLITFSSSSDSVVFVWFYSVFFGRGSRCFTDFLGFVTCSQGALEGVIS